MSKAPRDETDGPFMVVEHHRHPKLKGHDQNRSVINFHQYIASCTASRPAASRCLPRNYIHQVFSSGSRLNIYALVANSNDFLLLFG